jgi:hypothetical protein
MFYFSDFLMATMICVNGTVIIIIIIIKIACICILFSFTRAHFVIGFWDVQLARK